MAQDFNSFSFVGRLVEDLQLVPGSDNRPGYARGRMASSAYNEEKTLWITVFFPEPLIAKIHEYMTKGKPLAVTGRLSMDNYEDKTGIARTGLSLNATSVDFISGTRQQDGDETSQVPRRSKVTANKGDDLPF